MSARLDQFAEQQPERDAAASGSLNALGRRQLRCVAAHPCGAPRRSASRAPAHRPATAAPRPDSPRARPSSTCFFSCDADRVARARGACSLRLRCAAASMPPSRHAVLAAELVVELAAGASPRPSSRARRTRRDLPASALRVVVRRGNARRTCAARRRAAPMMPASKSLSMRPPPSTIGHRSRRCCPRTAAPSIVPVEIHRDAVAFARSRARRSRTSGAARAGSRSSRRRRRR